MANEFKIKKGLIVTGADGGTVVDVQGSQGQLFSVTDDLSGSIFAVSDISGVPILDVNSSGLSTFDGDVNLPDNKKILLGTGNDIELYHDGTHSHIINNTGDLTIDSQGDDLLLKAADDFNVFVQGSDIAIQAIGDGKVGLRYNNVEKFATTSSGVSVAGDINQGALYYQDTQAGRIGFNRNTTNGVIHDADYNAFQFNGANASGVNGKFEIQSYTQSGGFGGSITISKTSDLTTSSQVFSAATSSGDASSTLTTKGYVDSLITGATIYRGAWQAGISATSSAATTASTTLTVTAAILDADGNTPVLVGAVVTGEGITGIVKVASVTSSTVYVLDTAIDATATAYIFSPIHGAPSLDGVTQTSGYYYICSEAGSATPNGANSEPNTWNVGDWCIYNDVSGTGQWQKIDNSSVLSGAGTGQTVALWEGPSSVTDSETLGNAPITVSGSNTTFAGTVNADLGIVASGAMSSFETTLSNNDDWVNSPISILERGNVQGTQTEDKYAPNLNFHWGGKFSASLWMSTNGHLHYGQYGATGIPASDGTINAATFLGELGATSTINTGVTGTTQSAGNNSTLMATTAYADAAASAVPIGNYLPLAGGTMTGGLIGTTATFSGLTTLETFPQTQPIRGEVYSIDPHKYVGGVSYWTWTKIAQLDADGHASLRYNCKADVNYPHVAVGWVTISSFNASTISISHQQIIPSETIQPQVWLDNNRDVWIRMVNASWTTNFQYNWEAVDPGVATIYDGTTQSNTQPANSTVIEVGQEIKFPYTNAAAPVATATYIPVTTTGNILARNGNITLGGTGRIQGVDTVSASTDAANKAYVDAHVSPAGTYLPLSAGDSYPLTGNLVIEGSAKVLRLKRDANQSWIQYVGSNDDFIIRDETDSRSAFVAKGDGDVYFPGGNVGIGQTSPQAKLDIYDTFTKTAANPNTVEVFHSGSVISNNIYPVAGLFTQQVSGGSNSYATGLVGVADKQGNYGYIARGVQGIGKLSGDVTVNNADMQYMGVEGRIEMEGSNSVNLDDRAYSFYGTAEIDSGSHLKEYHGLYLNTPTNNGTILNKYGISQVDANSKNYFAGNVGIGTTNPGYKLHVNGGGLQTTTLTGNRITYYDGNGIGAYSSTGWNIGNYVGDLSLTNNADDKDIIFKTSAGTAAAVEIMRIDGSSGNVGIGVTNPNGKLEVNGIVKIGNVTTGLSMNGSSATEFLISGADTGGNAWNSIHIKADGNDGLFIEKDTNNVGIGTTNPRDALEIVGNMRFVNGEDHLMIKPNSDIQGADFIVGDGVDATDTPVMSLNGLYGGQVTIQTQGSSVADKTVLDVQGTQGQLFSVTDNLSGDIFSVADISGVPILNVNSSGLVTVDGTSYFDGNVGIGTNSPGAKLEIEGDATSDDTPQLIIASGGVDNNSIIHFTDDEGGQVNAIGSLEGNILTLASQSELVFKTGTASILGNTNTKMTIATDGNVGIGTGTPGDKLHVNGTVRSQAPTTSDWGFMGFNSAGTASSGLWFDNGSGDILLRKSDNTLQARIRSTGYSYINGGNLGLGTTNPAQKLTINGGRMLVTNNTTPIYIKVNSGYKSWTHHISADDGYIFAPSTADGGETWDWANGTKIGANGVVTAKNFVLSSDKRNKTKIEDLTGDNIDVSWKSFEMKGDQGEYRTGVIAQELEEKHPEFVNTNDEGFKSVKYIDLLIAKIAELEARLEKLEK